MKKKIITNQLGLAIFITIILNTKVMVIEIKHKTPSIEGYFNEIKQYLKHIINNLKDFETLILRHRDILEILLKSI